MMRLSTISAGLLCLLFLPGAALAQSHQIKQITARDRAVNAVIALGTQIEETTLDCSHFVNSLFARVGLDYDYEPSRVLYRGTEAFKRVYRPVSGDLIVWPGHVGVIVDPKEKTFVSALRTGVKVASYTSNYWRRRGSPHFLRYTLPIDKAALQWSVSGDEATAETIDSGSN